MFCHVLDAPPFRSMHQDVYAYSTIGSNFTPHNWIGILKEMEASTLRPSLAGFWSRGSRGWLTKTFTTSWRLLYPWCCGRCVGGSPQFARRQRCEGWFRSLERLGRNSGSKNYGTRTHIPYREKPQRWLHWFRAAPQCVVVQFNDSWI